MSSSAKNLSDFSHTEIPSAEGLRIAIVTAQWNLPITGVLQQGAIDLLRKQGISTENLVEYAVPGSFELVNGARLALIDSKLDAVICIGCVVKGDTPHFEYICSGVTQGLAALNAMQDVPVIFGVLTTLNEQQALDRAGGIHGNKGEEAAVTALQMAHLRKKILNRSNKSGIGFQK